MTDRDPTAAEVRGAAVRFSVILDAHGDDIVWDQADYEACNVMMRAADMLGRGVEVCAANRGGRNAKRWCAFEIKAGDEVADPDMRPATLLIPPPEPKGGERSRPATVIEALQKDVANLKPKEGDDAV